MSGQIPPGFLEKSKQNTNVPVSADQVEIPILIYPSLISTSECDQELLMLQTGGLEDLEAPIPFENISQLNRNIILGTGKTHIFKPTKSEIIPLISGCRPNLNVSCSVAQIGIHKSRYRDAPSPWGFPKVGRLICGSQSLEIPTQSYKPTSYIPCYIPC